MTKQEYAQAIDGAYQQYVALCSTTTATLVELNTQFEIYQQLIADYGQSLSR